MAPPAPRLGAAAARPDDVRHEVRPDRRPGGLPGARAAPVDTRHPGRPAEPGLRLPVPAGTVLPRDARAPPSGVARSAAVVGPAARGRLRGHPSGGAGARVLVE